MAGTDKAEVAYLWNKAEVWAEQIRTRAITKNDAWYALNTTVMKTMEYQMAAIYLSKPEWDYVMVLVLEAGYNLAENSPGQLYMGPNKFKALA